MIVRKFDIIIIIPAQYNINISLCITTERVNINISQYDNSITVVSQVARVSSQKCWTRFVWFVTATTASVLCSAQHLGVQCWEVGSGHCHNLQWPVSSDGDCSASAGTCVTRPVVSAQISIEPMITAYTALEADKISNYKFLKKIQNHSFPSFGFNSIIFMITHIHVT